MGMLGVVSVISSEDILERVTSTRSVAVASIGSSLKYGNTKWPRFRRVLTITMTDRMIEASAEFMRHKWNGNASEYSKSIADRLADFVRLYSAERGLVGSRASEEFGHTF